MVIQYMIFQLICRLSPLKTLTDKLKFLRSKKKRKPKIKNKYKLKKKLGIS